MGWLSGSDVQFIVIKVGTWEHPDRLGTVEAKCSINKGRTQSGIIKASHHVDVS